MKLFRAVVLVIALAAGGIAAYLALNMSPGAAPEQPVVELAPQIQSQDVLVASADIGQGQRLTEDNIRWQRWPDDAINPGYIQKQATPDAIKEMAGSVVRSEFVTGEPIRNVKLASAESGFLSAILPSGMRAIAVRVSANNTAGGFILPNDRVDVIQTLTQQGGTSGPAQNVSRTILTNVKVLAIDQTVSDQEGESVVVGKTATLELDPTQVELITAAESSGELSLALRSFADTDEVSQIATPTRKTSNSSVKVFRGGRLQELTVGLGTQPQAGAPSQPIPEEIIQAGCRQGATTDGTFSQDAFDECVAQARQPQPGKLADRGKSNRDDRNTTRRPAALFRVLARDE